MAEAAYVTLEEAAELENVKYNTLVQRIKRDDGCRYEIQTERNRTGGRDIVLVSVNSLSRAGRLAWKKREELKQLADVPEDQTGSSPKSEKPWYVDADYEWYMHQYKKRYYEGVELGNAVREYLTEIGGRKKDLTEFTEIFARERVGKSGRTFRRMVESYQEAAAWADKLRKENGCSYDHLMVLAVCRKPREVGLFPSMTAEVKQCVKNIWFDREFAQNRRTREDLYELLQEIAEEKEWKKIPSYQTVVRYITYLMEDEGMRSAHAYVKNGVVAWKNQNMVKRARDTKSLQVLEMVQGDEHTFDLWVMYKTPNGREIPIRPKLVCWIDTRSRMILGDIICRDANSQILKESLLKLIYVDAGSVPKYLYIDNGKDYTSKEMLGRDRKDRHNQESKEKYFDMEFDGKTRGFYRDMGIVDEHISMPYEPWTKGQIERSFGTAINKFSKKFASYTGTLTASGTDSKVPKDIKKMAERGELLTMEEFYEEWKKFKEKYAKRVHRSLKSMKEKYTTPGELFSNGERYVKPALPRSVAVMCMMKPETALINNIGIQRNGFYYMHDALCGYIGKKLPIRVDPYDVSSIYVQDVNGKFLCQAYSQELLQFGNTSDEALKKHRKMQNRQLSDVRKTIEEATTPFDELNEGYQKHKDVIGGVRVTIGKEPRKSKVVQMPEDGAAFVQIQKAKKEEEKRQSDYMDKMAQKALAKLRAIGCEE